MISFTTHKDPARVIRNAVMDDVTPAGKGQVFEYWRGETDLEPIGVRKAVFKAAWELYDIGRVVLYQVRHGDGDYSYRAEVV